MTAGSLGGAVVVEEQRERYEDAARLNKSISLVI